MPGIILNRSRQDAIKNEIKNHFSVYNFINITHIPHSLLTYLYTICDFESKTRESTQYVVGSSGGTYMCAFTIPIAAITVRSLGRDPTSRVAERASHCHVRRRASPGLDRPLAGVRRHEPASGVMKLTPIGHRSTPIERGKIVRPIPGLCTGDLHGRQALRERHWS